MKPIISFVVALLAIGLAAAALSVIPTEGTAGSMTGQFSCSAVAGVITDTYGQKITVYWDITVGTNIYINSQPLNSFGLPIIPAVGTSQIVTVILNPNDTTTDSSGVNGFWCFYD